MANDLPALLGGKPIRPEGPPAWPFPDPDVDAAITSALADGSWGEYRGPHVPRLEAALCETFGVTHALTTTSGTLSVETALRAIGVGPGDEVVMGAYDYEPNFLTVHAVGATPVLVDVAKSNACLDVDQLESAIGPATKAILATHLHGGLLPMPRVMSIAAKHLVCVVEDAAQVSGAIVAGRPAGSWGDFGVLSFGGSKLLTAGRGGAILTSNVDLFQRARLTLARGVQQWAAMSQLQAAALLPQLRKLVERTRRRHSSVTTLTNLLRHVSALRPFAACADLEALAMGEFLPGYFKVGFLLDESAFGISRDSFVNAMRAEGIAFDAGFRPLHSGRSPSRYKAVSSLVNAEIAGQTVVCLHHPVLSLGPTEIEQVAEAVHKTYRNASCLR